MRLPRPTRSPVRSRRAPVHLAAVVTGLVAALALGTPAATALPADDPSGASVRAVPVSLDTDPPTAPVIIEPAPGWVELGQLFVRWQPSTDAGSGVVAYEMLVDGEVALRVPAYWDGAIVPHELPGPLTLQVRAVDDAGNTAVSAAVEVEIGEAPSQPVVEVVSGHHHAVVSWQPVVASPEVTGYTVRARDTVDWSAPQQVLELAAGATSARIDGLVNGRFYDITVAATNVLGTGPETSEYAMPRAVFVTSPTYSENVQSPVHLAWEPAPGLGPVAYYVIELDRRPLRFVEPGTRSVTLPLRQTHSATLGVRAVLVDGTAEEVTELPVWVIGESAMLFGDVPQDAPFYRQIFWLVQAGIAGGYADGTYRPTAAVSRGAMAAFLHRFAAAELSGYEPPAVATFSDVPVTHPFFTEIEWLAATGITTGYADGTFRSTSPVSRGAMAAFLYRFADGPTSGYQPPDEEWFDDVPRSHAFFTEIAWLAEHGVSTGYSDWTFRPGAAVSRGAMAAFLARFAGEPETDSTVASTETAPDAGARLGSGLLEPQD